MAVAGLVIFPCRRESPPECSLGARPRKLLGVRKAREVPSSATSVVAATKSTLRKLMSTCTTTAQRQPATYSRSAAVTRSTRLSASRIAKVARHSGKVLHPQKALPPFRAVLSTILMPQFTQVGRA